MVECLTVCTSNLPLAATAMGGSSLLRRMEMLVPERRTSDATCNTTLMLMMVSEMALSIAISFWFVSGQQQAIAAPPQLAQTDLSATANVLADKPDQMTAEASAFVKRLWERDAEFDPRSVEMIRSWVKRVEPRAQLSCKAQRGECTVGAAIVRGADGCYSCSLRSMSSCTVSLDDDRTWRRTRIQRGDRQCGRFRSRD